jgi:hypothetical protein
MIASTGLISACGGSTAQSDSTDAGSVDSGNPDSQPNPPDSGLDVQDVDSGVKEYTGPLPISKKPDSSYEAETQIAVAPDGTIAMVWNSATVDAGPRIGYRFSMDDGVTFTPIRYIDPPKLGLAGTDPAIAVDSNGNFYASILGLHYGQTGDFGDMHVYVAKAPAGSTSFGQPIEVTDPATSVTEINDHPKIKVTQHGTVVVVFMNSGGGIAARSPDGVNWQRSTITQESSNLFSLCEGGGNLYTTYVGNYGIELRASQDEGQTWSTDATYVSPNGETPAYNDPTCVAQGSEVWVTYGISDGNFTGEDALDPAVALNVAHSSDFGVSFPTHTNALDGASGKLALHPVLVREAGGAFDLAYLTGAAEMDSDGSLRWTHAASTTFGQSVRVDGPVVFQLSRVADNWLGDYMGCAEHDGTVYFTYPKNYGSLSHVWFAKLPIQ